MFKWIDKHKDTDNGFINFLKFLYSVGKIQVVQSIIVTILSVFIPLLFTWGQNIWAIILLFAWILLIIFFAICSNYRQRKYEERKFASEILDDQSSLANTLNMEIKSNSQWKTAIFKKISEIVCEKIQHIFKEVLHCSTRVSVEYVFDKDDKVKNKTEKHVKMSGRRSPDRASCKKSTLLQNRSKYFSYRVFTNNKVGINILSHDEIENGCYWYKNPSHTSNVKQYIGIAVSVQDDEHVDYILQIDCLDDIVFGKNNNKEEIKQFINQYLKSYINIVSLSYLLNLNKYKKIPEV